MEYLIVCATALLASGVTLYSGFGLGTVLMPAFALFFPTAVAIAATAVVHLANNLFKIGLVGRHADWGVALRFSLPAAVAAIAGAALLNYFADLPALSAYQLGGQTHSITVLKIVIGLLIIVFAILELSPSFAKLTFPARYIPLGGLLSGFFGGLSGNQGAFRSAFLIKAGLPKESFIATGVVAAVIVDVARLAVYWLSFQREHFASLPRETIGLVGAATASAFCGAYIGARLMAKVTLRAVQLTVAGTMALIGAALASGLV